MTKELPEHVHCTMTVGKSRLVRLQLVPGGDKKHMTETCCSRHSRTVGVRQCDHISEKLTGIVRHSDHQSDGDTHLVPNYPCWIPRKSIPSLDKWTLFPSINTNFLTLTRVKPSLDPRNIFSTIFFAVTLLFSATYYIYSQTLLCHDWLYHLSSFGKYHTGVTPLSLTTTWLPNIFSSESIRNITVL